ncbi:helix-turn-helix domain-containing protein [Paenibacillus sp. strain BS8-2]
MDKDLVEFGKFFKQHRIASGYKSQRQLALESKISNGTIARIEGGTQKALPETLRVLAKHIKTASYSELMYKAGYMEDGSILINGVLSSPESAIEQMIESATDGLTIDGTFMSSQEALEYFRKKQREKREAEITNYLDRPDLTYNGASISLEDRQRIKEMLGIIFRGQ